MFKMFIFDTCWKIFSVNIFKKRHYLKCIKKKKKKYKKDGKFDTHHHVYYY